MSNPELTVPATLTENLDPALEFLLRESEERAAFKEALGEEIPSMSIPDFEKKIADAAREARIPSHEIDRMTEHLGVYIAVDQNKNAVVKLLVRIQFGQRCIDHGHDAVDDDNLLSDIIKKINRN